LMNPKVFSELSTDDQAKLELLVATELGMHWEDKAFED
jgi:hypothetical protein